ncbi:DUF3667 domain-containing protein [Maribacter algicola]|uniref:DUF3667 domain-containing protein n=1 Tax=Meishania litoralis TaxID=3434685 RepID=A0ACC7LJC8_9FLAO
MSEKFEPNTTDLKMTCKNCKSELSETSNFCDECGAKVVKKRITAIGLLSDIVQNVFGWDTKYFFTIRTLITEPGLLFKEYLEGTRKKYVNPFTFLVIGMTVAILTFNFFDEQFIEANKGAQKAQMEWMAEKLGGPYASGEFQAEQLESSEKQTRFMLKYFNILVVLLLPIYSFLAFIIYRRPYNYGEHIVINSFIQGLSFISISILFLISLVTHPLLYGLNSLLLLVFYTYAYGKLYRLSLGQSILKVLLFIAILSAFTVATVIVAYLIAKFG